MKSTIALAAVVLTSAASAEIVTVEFDMAGMTVDDPGLSTGSKALLKNTKVDLYSVFSSMTSLFRLVMMALGTELLRCTGGSAHLLVGFTGLASTPQVQLEPHSLMTIPPVMITTI